MDPSDHSPWNSSFCRKSNGNKDELYESSVCGKTRRPSLQTQKQRFIVSNKKGNQCLKITDRMQCLLIADRIQCLLIADRMRCFLIADRMQCLLIADRMQCLLIACRNLSLLIAGRSLITINHQKFKFIDVYK